MCLEIRRDVKIVSNLNSTEMFSWSLLKTITSTVHSFLRIPTLFLLFFFLGFYRMQLDFVVRDQAHVPWKILPTARVTEVHYAPSLSTPSDYSTVWFSLGNSYICIFLIWYVIALQISRNCHHISCKTSCW